MNDPTTFLLSVFGVGLVLFLLLRFINLWYWKINERVFQQTKTNFLLERIWEQLGASRTDEITVEEIETGEKKTLKTDAWIQYTIENPISTKYKIVKTGQPS